GGWHLGFKFIDEELSVRIIRTAIDSGINFMDNCWDYNEGASEERMGKALKDGYRDRVFLMTKIDGRTKKDAAKQLDESLKRLQVDHIDLVQHHEILRYKDPHIHLYMLEVAKQNDFRFDTVQMPLNVMDAHFRSFEKLVLPELVREE